MCKTARYILELTILAAVAAAACTRAAVSAKPEAAPAAAEPMQASFVEQLLFGYWAGEPFASKWCETRDVPARPGLRFGWRIKLRSPHGKYVNVVERLMAPQPPATWGPLETRRLVSADRVVATSPNSLRVRDDWIQRANWMVSEGDPPGTYQFEVQINGRMAARVTFHLVATALAPPTANPAEGTSPAPEEEEVEDELPDEPQASPAPATPAD